MIKLNLKKSISRWIQMGEGVKFLISYPSIEHEQYLQELLIEILNEKRGKSEEFIPPAQLKYAQYTVKYSVKDWQGLDEKCILVNNELENSLWWALVSDPIQAVRIFTLIQPEVEVTQEDKKKLVTVDTSTTKES